MAKKNKNKNKVLKILPLGGMGDVTKNIYVYEYGDDIIVMDCGIGFPEGELLGVDIIIPDVNYLKKNAHKIRAFIITHGHNDHYAALPYVIPQLNSDFPIYSTKLVVGLIKNQLKEFNLLGEADLREIDPEGESIQLGNFSVSAFRVNHSVPDTAGFVIDTPEGKIVHVSDFKFDWTPVDNKPFDVQRLCNLIGKDDVSVLLSDCLGSHSPGYTESEKGIEKQFDALFDEAEGQVFVTATSSNISRMQQAINSSVRHGRRVALLGRSVRDNINVALELGYIQVPDGTIIHSRKAKGVKDNKITYIAAGSYGQKGSALQRLSEGENRSARVKEGDMVIFSSDPSPSGVKDAVDTMVDKLTNLGADVHHYEIQENLHVSGHGSQGDQLMLARIVDPKTFIPIGGTASTMRGYTKLMQKAGYDPRKVYELQNGETLEVDNEVVSKGKKIRVSEVFVDGLGVGDVGRRVLEERQVLSESGVLVVAIPVSEKTGSLAGSVEVTSRGFVFEKDSKKLLNDAQKMSNEIASKELGRKKLPEVRKMIKDKVGKSLFKRTQREPIVLPVIVSV